MADGSHIEWTDATWNPLVGCTKVSPGCDNCYAEGVVNRWHAADKPAFPARFDTVSLRSQTFMTQPLRWTKPRRVFVNSLADLFHTDVPDEFIAQVFAVMAAAHRHTFQLLTKRHARMRSLLTTPDFLNQVAEEATELLVTPGPYDNPALDINHPVWHAVAGGPDGNVWHPTWPLPNVWLGVSVEDQHWADIRIPALLATPAAVRWISAEPLLGPLCLCDYLRADRHGARLDWVVTGGESGPGARPMHPRWAIDIADDCQDHDIAYLHKQNGAYLPDRAGGYIAVDTDGREYPGQLRRVSKTVAGRQLDGRTHDGYPTPTTTGAPA